MQIFVRNLSGKTVTIDINERDIVYDLKTILANKEGLPVSNQRLMFQGKLLKLESIISECDIKKGSTIHMNVRFAYWSQVYIFDC